VRRGFITRAAAGLLAVLTVISLAACSNAGEETMVTEAAAIKVTVAKPSVGYIDQVTAFTGRIPWSALKRSRYASQQSEKWRG